MIAVGVKKKKRQLDSLSIPANFLIPFAQCDR
jgi:hypothetical protein